MPPRWRAVPGSSPAIGREVLDVRCRCAGTDAGGALGREALEEVSSVRDFSDRIIGLLDSKTVKAQRDVRRVPRASAVVEAATRLTGTG
jgi:hypothetical protein